MPHRPAIYASRQITVEPAAEAAFAEVQNTSISCKAAPPQPSSLAYTNGESGDCAISGTSQSTITGGHNSCGGSYTETWTFTDECNRQITHSRTIMVEPAAQAQFESAPELTFNCSAPAPTPAELAYGNGGTGDCEISGSQMSTITGNGDTYTETWTFTDACGRTSTRSRTITQPSAVTLSLQVTACSSGNNGSIRATLVAAPGHIRLRSITETSAHKPRLIPSPACGWSASANTRLGRLWAKSP